MAWPDDASFASYDKTSGTWGINVDSKLWPALTSKSPLLDRVQRFQVDEVEFKWETDNMPARTYVLANSSNGIEDANSGANVAATFTSGTPIQKGSILKNVSRATPIGTYGADELLEVTANTAGACTVVRDVGRQNAGAGSDAHTIGDSFQIVYAPKPEGSDPDQNMYKDVTLVSNYVNAVDYYIEVTGDMAAARPLVQADNLANQVAKGVLHVKNELESMLLYACLNNGANAGSSSYVRRTKGVDQFITASGANIDYSTKDVTEAALNALVGNILDDGTDESDDLIIVCHPIWARTMSETFGVDKVRITQGETKWGRSISTFASSSGVDLDIIPTLNCSKSDLFILDMNKIGLATYRPFAQSKVTFADDMTDKVRQRTLGVFGVKVVDALYSHAKLGYLTWPS